MSGRTVIGLVSDTHGLLRPEVARWLAGADLIVHAGDVGGAHVLQGLSAIAPTFAVAGNVDDPHDPMLVAARSLPVGGLVLHVSHGHELGRPTPDALLAKYDADVLIFGHTHRVLEHRAPDGRIVLNPGSAGPRRFSLPVTAMTVTIHGRQVDVRVHAMGN